MLMMVGAFAVLDDAVAGYTLDDADLSGSDPLDVSGNNNDLTNTGATTGVTGKVNEAIDFDGVNDYLQNSAFSIIPSSTQDISISYWVNQDALTNSDYHFSLGSDSTGDWLLRAYFYSSVFYLETQEDGSGGTSTQLTKTGLSANTWYHMVATYDGTTKETKLYVDNVLADTDTSTAGGTTGTNMVLGAGIVNGAVAGYMDGTIDATYVYDRVLTVAEISDLYNSGSGLQPNFNASAETNHTIEQTAEFEQPGLITYKSTSYTTIFSQTFQVVNDTEAYSSFVSEIETDRVDDVTCRVLLNGTDYDTELTRSFNANEKGIMYLFSSNYTLTAGVDYLMQFQCLNGANPTNTDVIDTDGIIHILTNENGEDINHNYYNGSLTFNATTYQPLLQTTFQVSNQTEGDLERIIVIEGDINYIYDADATQTLIAEVDGQNTTVFPRYGTTGTSGSGGGFYFTYNVTTNTTANVTIWGKSTSASGSADVSFMIKEFILHTDEGKQEDLINTNYDSRTFTTIKTLTVNNSVHTNGDLVVKASVSAQSLAGDQEVTYRLSITGEDSQNYTRTINNAGAGVLVVQHVFDNIGTGVLSVDLESYSDVGEVNITGGAFIAYIADQVGVTQEGFYASGVDQNNGTVIPNTRIYFNGGGSIGTGADGLAFVPLPPNQLVNLTFTGTDYFNTTIYDHNTSNNITAEMHQGEVRFQALEIITNNTVNPSNYTINGSTYGFNDTVNLSAGNWTVLFSAANYFNKEQTFEVLPLDDKVVYVTSVSGSIINITAEDFFNSTSIDTFSITISNDTLNYEESLSTTSGFIQAPVLQGYNYLMVINASGYAIQNASLLADEPVENQTFRLYTQNSFNFTIRDETTREIINDTNFTIQFVGLESYTFNTANGSIYVDLITPDDYEIRYFSNEVDTYKLRSNFVTVTPQSFQDINLYAIDDANASITTSSTTFIVYDGNVDPVPNALVRINRYYPQNNSFEKVSDRYTDANGEAFMILESIDAFYQIVVIYNDEIKYNSLVDVNQQVGIQFQTGTLTYPLFITLESTLTDVLNIAENIVTSLTLVNRTNATGFFTFTVDYSQTVTACLDILYSDNQTIQTDCMTRDSVAIQLPINVSKSQTVTAIGRVLAPGFSDYETLETKTVFMGKSDRFEDNDWTQDFKFFVGFLLMILIPLIFYKVIEVALITQTIAFYLLTFEYSFFTFSEGTTGMIISFILFIVFLIARRK